MDPKQLNEAQIKVIKDHIGLVLTKVTPQQPTNWGELLKPVPSTGDKLTPYNPPLVTCSSSAGETADSKECTSIAVGSLPTPELRDLKERHGPFWQIPADATGKPLDYLSESTAVELGPIRGGGLKLC